ncbi:MAG: toll/interleukin-1 receptor domain-containing protein [Rhizobiaceae bacterium]|nr:toll/interleukin-1 receptor domain-containing protein [Rhizobiaceae bacterium]
MAPKQIFISHTKQEAAIALILKRFIDTQFAENVGTFVSATDIAGGVQWLRAVEAALRGADLVIVLCSPRSVRKPWVLFEAGGAWARERPLLPICHSGLAVSDLISPLSSFQAISLDAADFAPRFYRSIGEMISIPMPRAAHELAALSASVKAEAQAVAAHHNVFVSAPMSSLANYASFRKSLQPALDSLRRHDALANYYFSGVGFAKPSQFDEQTVGMQRDFNALANSDRYMLVLPEKIASGVLVEAGFALAKGIPSVLFVTDPDHLPYALREIGQISTSTRIVRFKTIKDIATVIERNGPALWPYNWGKAYE